MHLNIFFFKYVFIFIYLIYNLIIIFHINNYLATVQDKNEDELKSRDMIFVIFLGITSSLNIILLIVIIVGVKYYKETQKTKIQGEYTWFDVYYITTHWYNNCYAFTQQVFIFWLHIFALVHRTPNGSFVLLCKFLKFNIILQKPFGQQKPNLVGNGHCSCLLFRSESKMAETRGSKVQKWYSVSC